jgi:hypothetical protein
VWTSVQTGGPEQWHDTVEQWRALGATHVSFNVANAASAHPDRHIDALRRFREAVPV